MKLQPGLVFAGLLALGLSTYSCANGDTVSSDTGSGGSNGSGSGGSNGSGSGGSNGSGSGGNQNKGGNTGSGGSSRGGNTGSGGSISSGSGGSISTGSGGIQNKGGNTGSGGQVVVTGSGGSISSGSGGATGAGGSSTGNCGTSFQVNATGFVTMPAVGGGCWTGFASDGGDAGSTIMPGAFSTCGTPCMLTMTGTLNASTSANSYAGYSYLGFNIGQSASSSTASAVTPMGSSITVTYTNTDSSPTVRVALNADSTGTTSWCAAVTSSPATIKYSAFTEQCYNATPGAAYAKQGIVSVQLSVPGGATTGPVSITLVSVVENP